MLIKSCKPLTLVYLFTTVLHAIGINPEKWHEGFDVIVVDTELPLLLLLLLLLLIHNVNVKP